MENKKVTMLLTRYYDWQAQNPPCESESFVRDFDSAEEAEDYADDLNALRGYTGSEWRKPTYRLVPQDDPDACRLRAQAKEIRQEQGSETAL